MSATDDRSFADVRPLFDAWQTARRAAVRAADPQYEDRRERALRAVARGMLRFTGKCPALTDNRDVDRALSVALLQAYLDGLEDGRMQGIHLLEILLGKYLPTAPRDDYDAIERFIGYIREQYGITDADLDD